MKRLRALQHASSPEGRGSHSVSQFRLYLLRKITTGQIKRQPNAQKTQNLEAQYTLKTITQGADEGPCLRDLDGKSGA